MTDYVLPDRNTDHHGRAVHEGLLRPAGRHLPPARRLRDRRDGRLHPVPARPGDQRGRVRQGARGQDQGGRRRVRGILGGPPRPGADLPGDLRRRARRRRQPAGQAAAARSTVTAKDLLDIRSLPLAGHRGRVCGTTSRSRWSTRSTGWPAAARSASTT